MDHLLRELLALLHTIRNSHKGSIGTIDNIYMPRLYASYIDPLTDRVAEYLNHVAEQDTNKSKHWWNQDKTSTPPPEGASEP